jgi:hypothetical protein
MIGTNPFRIYLILSEIDAQVSGKHALIEAYPGMRIRSSVNIRRAQAVMATQLLDEFKELLMPKIVRPVENSFGRTEVIKSTLGALRTSALGINGFSSPAHKCARLELGKSTYRFPGAKRFFPRAIRV